MSKPNNATIIAELNRAKAIFQLRAISAAIGLPLTPPAPAHGHQHAATADDQESGEHGGGF